MGERYHMHLLFNNGVTVTVEVADAASAGISGDRGRALLLKYPAPKGWQSMLDWADLNAVIAVWFTRESDESEASQSVPR
jgi:hypothetical protein